MGSRDHASFFSGAGGLDLGLERAGWRTVSFSEIDPYASAVLAQRWPGVPNLGDITDIARRRESERSGGQLRQHTLDGAVVHAGVGPSGRAETRRAVGAAEDREWHRASLWTGGFPCQDLSVAGKRRGLAGSRSGLAFAFLELVGRHRPRFVLLENVPGLLSSHGGKDFGTLLAAMVELGYGVGYRVLDARYFGVPQRRRRVFILGDSLGGRAGAERAAEVLSVGSRCHRHPPAGIEAGPGAAAGARPGIDIARAVTGTSGKRHDDDTDTLLPEIVGALNDLGHHGWTANAQSVAQGHVIRETPYSRGVRAPDGLAGRSHDRGGVAATLNSGGNDGGFRTEPGDLVAYTKSHNVDGNDNAETWVTGREARSMNGFDGNRTSLVLNSKPDDDPLLPLGLDSHRYRCCGNGVVADVGEWIGQRLLEIA